MNLSDITNHVDFLTGQDTTAFPNADRLISLNKWYHKVVTMILASQDDWDFDDDNRLDFPIMTTPMVAGQRDYEIPVSEDVLQIKRIDVTYDGNEYNKAEPLDIAASGRGFGNDTTVDGRFSKSEPFYDMRKNSIFLYPRATAAEVTAGAEIKLYVQRDVADFTSGDLTTGTLVPGFDEPFHEILSLGAAHDWFVAHGPRVRANEFKDELLEVEQRIKQFYGSKQGDRRMVLKSQFDGDEQYL